MMLLEIYSKELKIYVFCSLEYSQGIFRAVELTLLYDR